MHIILEQADACLHPTPRKKAMAARKNAYYVELIGKLTPEDILPGAMDVLRSAQGAGREGRHWLIQPQHAGHSFGKSA